MVLRPCFDNHIIAFIREIKFLCMQLLSLECKIIDYAAFLIVNTNIILLFKETLLIYSKGISQDIPFW
jgi:hypothetical protein